MININKHNDKLSNTSIAPDFIGQRCDEKVYGWQINPNQKPFNAYKNKILHAEDDVAV